jgi:hypothetical protein
MSWGRSIRPLSRDRLGMSQGLRCLYLMDRPIHCPHCIIGFAARDFSFAPRQALEPVPLLCGALLSISDTGEEPFLDNN